MNNYDKIKVFCRSVRLSVGTALMVYGMYADNMWFFLGVIPLLAGILNICPLCLISKKCTIPTNNVKIKEVK